MRNRLLLLSLTTVLVSCLPMLAMTPIAKVTSAEPFTVDGQSITPTGITPMAVVVGSEVATSIAPAVLFFADGSSVKLAPASRAKLMGSELQPKLILLAGSLDYKVVLGSTLSVTSLDLERNSRRVGRSVKPATKPLATPRADEVTLTEGLRR